MEINTAHQPFFSVVMPAYNVRDYIGEAIDSILHQSFTDWELIIVDDCSTDGTYGIIQEYAAKNNNIRYFRTEKNSGGCIVPRNLAVEHSIGKYITYLDADDWFEENYLKKIQSKINETFADCIICLNPNDSRLNSLYRGQEAVKFTVPDWNIAVGLCYTKSAYKKSASHLSDYKIPYADEVITRLTIMFSTKVAFSDAKYHYRYNENGVSKKIENIIDKVKVAFLVDKIFSLYYANDTDIMKSVSLMKFREVATASHLIGVGIRRGKFTDGREKIKDIKSCYSKIKIFPLLPFMTYRDLIKVAFGKYSIDLLAFYGFLKGR